MTNRERLHAAIGRLETTADRQASAVDRLGTMAAGAWQLQAALRLYQHFQDMAVFVRSLDGPQAREYFRDLPKPIRAELKRQATRAALLNDGKPGRRKRRKRSIFEDRP